MRTWHFDDPNLGNSIRNLYNSYHKDCLRYDISEDKTTEEIQGENEKNGGGEEENGSNEDVSMNDTQDKTTADHDQDQNVEN